ncbi:membrane protein insertase YidC [Aquirhabdus parva]|uniref:Membrane protein insertase YidC n=1 Tax=Aquirhabdus parva TaxID=2283318 RepID=A0A345PAK1_9GAMM|nr:membrane protein insertase YidC [Aquirhabdus parva]AXI04310.1 membrane protein insertase YidC [Aquirhabdus parva]
MQKWAKYLILLGMFITAYMLILAWQKDYGHIAADQNVATPVAQTAQPASADIPNANASSVAATPVNNADVPPVATPKKEAAAPVIAPAPQGLITLQTDMYRITVDPKGGDVVRSELLNHLNAVDSQKAFVLLEDGPGRVYTAQSGLIGVDGPDAAATGRPLYTSAQTSYVLATGQTSLDVPLTFEAPNGVQIIKSFHLTAGQYPIKVSYQIINRGKKPWQGQMFGQVKRDNSADPSKANQGMMGMSTYMGGAWGTPDSHYNKLKFTKYQEDPLNQTVKGGWVAVLQHYFVTAWIPDANTTAVLSTRVSGNNNFIGFTDPVVTVAPGMQQTISATLYTGPKVQDNLKPLAVGLDQTVDYGWLWPIAQVLFLGLKYIHGFIGNWGWSIILLTLLVKIVLFPLSAKSYRSMAKMKVIAPEMQRLKEVHGEDRMKFSQEMMALYKKEGVNPLSGCLPILLQMPIFMSLYFVFMESVELRNAPWIGWITDLSSMDHWFVLPLIMGVTMFVQQALNPQPADPMQAKMLRLMPIVFTVFMLWFPSGLVLYWIVNNLLTIVQQKYVNHQIEKSYHPKVG